jgi:hypothetical protein
MQFLHERLSYGVKHYKKTTPKLDGAILKNIVSRFLSVSLSVFVSLSLSFSKKNASILVEATDTTMNKA